MEAFADSTRLSWPVGLPLSGLLNSPIHSPDGGTWVVVTSKIRTILSRVDECRIRQTSGGDSDMVFRD